MNLNRNFGTTIDGGNFMPDRIKQVWEKGKLITRDYFINIGVDITENMLRFILTDKFRIDRYDNIMKRGEYGKQTAYGWEIDHSNPISKNGTDHLNNLQPLHWRANREKGEQTHTEYEHKNKLGLQ